MSGGPAKSLGAQDMQGDRQDPGGQGRSVRFNSNLVDFTARMTNSYDFISFHQFTCKAIA